MIVKANVGIHQGVLWAEFGAGDIKFSRAKIDGNSFQTILSFQNQNPPRKIGEVSNEHVGKHFDEIDRPEFILEFRKKESLKAVIESLQDIYNQFPDNLELLNSSLVKN